MKFTKLISVFGFYGWCICHIKYLRQILVGSVQPARAYEYVSINKRNEAASCLVPTNAPSVDQTHILTYSLQGYRNTTCANNANSCVVLPSSHRNVRAIINDQNFIKIARIRVLQHVIHARGK